MSLFLKALLGGVAVLLIAFLSKSKNYYLAGLVPLFPTFALIAHFIVGTERSIPELRTTILFGMWSLLPYLVYLGSLYFLVEKMKLSFALTAAAVMWSVAAFLLVVVWSKVR